MKQEHQPRFRGRGRGRITRAFQSCQNMANQQEQVIILSEEVIQSVRRARARSRRTLSQAHAMPTRRNHVRAPGSGAILHLGVDNMPPALTPIVVLWKPGDREKVLIICIQWLEVIDALFALWTPH